MVTESLIVEDFESYNAGQHLVQQAIAQGKDYWTTWNNSPPGSAEDPMVSSDHSVSGSKSVLIEGTNDVVLLLMILLQAPMQSSLTLIYHKDFMAILTSCKTLTGQVASGGECKLF